MTWQRGGGHDRNLVDRRAAWDEINDLHAVPPRHGLCLRREDWKYSSAADYLRLRPSPIPIDRESLPQTDAG
ncbi:MAG: hypothetical protein KDA75_15770 [Planctomycetaceae bacterium]|nr:hypothetical protein [Planctomycetaceae bacterium]